MLQWFVGLAFTGLVLLISLAILPEEAPPGWFVKRVDSLESAMTQKLERLDAKIDKHLREHAP
jgi:hypothetical protein